MASKKPELQQRMLMIARTTQGGKGIPTYSRNDADKILEEEERDILKKKRASEYWRKQEGQQQQSSCTRHVTLPVFFCISGKTLRFTESCDCLLLDT